MYPKNMISIVANFYKNNDYSIREVAKIFNIGKSTIHRWLNSDNIIHDHKKHNNIIDIKLNIKNLLIQNPFITAKQIKSELQKTHNKLISISGIYTHIKQLGFSKKKVSKRCFVNKNILLQKQKDFKNKIKHIYLKDIVSIDETYFNSNISPNYGWSLKGERIIEYAKINPKKYCLLMAISNTKILTYKIYDTNINQNIYLNFLKDQLLPLIKNKHILIHRKKDKTRIFKTNNCYSN